MVTESVKQDQSNAPAAVAMLARVVAMLLWSRDDQSTMTCINCPAATAVRGGGNKFQWQPVQAPAPVVPSAGFTLMIKKATTFL